MSSRAAEKRYVKEFLLGRGSYADVYRVKCSESGTRYAMKCPAVRDVDDSLVRELSFLTSVDHVNVIKALDCLLCDEGRRVALIMPYVPYTLSHAIHAPGGVPSSLVARFSLQIASALACLHERNILHRDLTPNNVLLARDLTVKVADLGLARHAAKRMSLRVVTAPYRAPELFDQLGRGKLVGSYTSAVDVWSLGAVILDAMEGEVVFSPPPGAITALFSPRDPERARLNRLAALPRTMACEPARRLAFGLLTLEPEARLSALQVTRDAGWLALAASVTDEEKLAILTRCEQRLVLERSIKNDLE